MARVAQLRRRLGGTTLGHLRLGEPDPLGAPAAYAAGFWSKESGMVLNSGTEKRGWVIEVVPLSEAA